MGFIRWHGYITKAINDPQFSSEKRESCRTALEGRYLAPARCRRAARRKLFGAASALLAFRFELFTQCGQRSQLEHAHGACGSVHAAGDLLGGQALEDA